MSERGLFVGRYQPFHNGHLDAVRRLASEHHELVLGIGSANVSHSPTNPFTAGERHEMILASLRDAGISNVVIVPIPDVGRNSIWVSHVASLVPRFAVVHTNNPLPARLFSEAGYKVSAVPFFQREAFEGTRIRALISRDDPKWRTLVPPAVAHLIHEMDGVARMRDLARLDGKVEGSDPTV